MFAPFAARAMTSLMVPVLAHKVLSQAKTEHNASPAQSKIAFHVLPAIYVAIA